MLPRAAIQIDPDLRDRDDADDGDSKDDGDYRDPGPVHGLSLPSGTPLRLLLGYRR